MKAFLITGPGAHRFTEEREKPLPREGEVLLQVLRVGYCGSDLNTYRGKNPMVSYPRIPGHEVVGRIVEKGRGVSPDLALGAVATLLPYTNCGSCMSCREGRPNACESNQTLGVQRDGGLTEYLTVPAEKLITNVEGLSLRAITLVEPLAVGYHAAQRADVSPGDFTLVFGCGLVGLGAVSRSSEMGGRVIAVDIAPGKLELARRVGAEFTIDSSRQDIAARVKEITGGHGPKICLEAIGLKETFRTAVDLVSFCGRVVYVGYAQTPVDYETKYFVMKELQIRGARNADKKDFVNVLETLKTGRIPVDALITKELDFSQAGRAMEEWNRDPGKISKILIALAD